MMSSACWIGTSWSASPWMISVGGSSDGGVVDRADLAADLEDPGLVGDRPEHLGVGILLVEVERRLEALEDASAQGILAGLAVVQEVGRREEAGDRLDAARGLVDRVLGVGLPLVARGPQHQRQVPAGRASRDADPVGIDVIVGRMVAG